MQPLDSEVAQQQLEAYEAELQQLMDLALSGRIREDDFKREMERITVAAILLMYLLGGGDPAQQQAALAGELRQNQLSINTLADDVYSGRYLARDEAEQGRPVQTRDEGRAKLLTRLTLWVFAMSGVFAIGQRKAAKQTVVVGTQIVEVYPSYRWDLGNTEKHCSDCLFAAGKVLASDEWDGLAAIGIAPQSPSLECRGFRCDCRLVRVS